MDRDRESLERKKRFLEIQLRQKEATLNILSQTTSVQLKF